MNNEELTDFEEGSRIRTLLESAAIEDADQYAQLKELVNLYDWERFSGEELENRMAGIGIPRLGGKKASGSVLVTDRNALFSTLQANASTGAVSLSIEAGRTFSFSFPIFANLIQDLRIETVSVVAIDAVTGVVSIAAPLASGFLRGAFLVFVSGSSKTIPKGSLLRTEDLLAPVVRFLTLEEGTIPLGFLDSAPIGIEAISEGSLGNVARNTRIVFESSPFEGASASLLRGTEGGFDRQSDSSLRERARTDAFRTLARATTPALEAFLLGVRSLDRLGREWRVLSARVLRTEERGFLVVWPGGFGFVETEQRVKIPLLVGAIDGTRLFALGEFPLVPETLLLEKEVSPGLWEVIEAWVNEATGEGEFRTALSGGDSIRASYTTYIGVVREWQTRINGSTSRRSEEGWGCASAGWPCLVTPPRKRIFPQIRLAIQITGGEEATRILSVVKEVSQTLLQGIGLGGVFRRSELIEQLMRVEGIENVEVIEPTKDLFLDIDEAFDPADLLLLLQ